MIPARPRAPWGGAGGPLPLIAAGLIALALAACQIPRARLVDDDRIQTGILEGTVDCCGTAPFALYAFLDGSPGAVSALRDGGPLPWFVDPRMKIQFFRPISSALLSLDHALFGAWAPGYRLQTTLWYLTLVVVFGVTLRLAGAAREPGPARAGLLLAPLCFALSPLHWQTLAYTAARWVLIAAALGTVGLACHVAWRERGWRAGRPLSLCAWILSLLSGEAALSVMAYLLAYEWVGRDDAPRLRIRAAAPAAGLVVAYLAAYALLGYGSAGGEGYLDPLAEPLLFLREAPGRALAMTGEVLLGSYARLGSIEGMRMTSWLAGLAGIGLVAVPWRRFRGGIAPRSRRLVAWWGIGAAGSLLPLAGSPPDSRHLIIPAMGAAVPVSVVIACAFRRGRAAPGEVTRRRWHEMPLPIILCVVHLLMPPWRWYATTVDFEAYRDWFEATARRPDLVAEGPSPRTVFLTPLAHLTLQGWFLRKGEGLPLPGGWWPLSLAPVDHLYRRTGPRTLELETPGGRLMASAEERGVRRRGRPMRAGETFVLDGMTVTVLETDTLGPTRIRFEFDRVLEDPSMRFVAAPKGRVRIMRPPRPGETLFLPR